MMHWLVKMLLIVSVSVLLIGVFSLSRTDIVCTENELLGYLSKNGPSSIDEIIPKKYSELVPAFRSDILLILENLENRRLVEVYYLYDELFVRLVDGGGA